MKCSNIVLIITFLTVIVTVNGFDGFKLDDMGNPVKLNSEAPQAKTTLQGQGMERFREAAPVNKIQADPHIAKLVKEKTEIAIKLRSLNQ